MTARAPDRRLFLERLGWMGIALIVAASVPGSLRFLRPRRGTTAGRVFDAGTLDEYRQELVSARWVKRHRVWIVRDAGGLHALEARCTHLGCTPRWDRDTRLFLCPCHGSQFSPEGVALNGPARDPLRRAAIRREGDRVLVDPGDTVTLEEAERSDRYVIPL